MILKIFKSTASILALVTMVNTQAFDCSVIYDEFDSLMHKEFLLSPDNYVASISGEISFEDFNAAQRGKLFLRKDRLDRGVGIIFTNNKLYGKFVFDWRDSTSIMIEDIIIYSRVEDGYAPIHHWQLSVQQGDKIDLDSGKVIIGDDHPDDELLRADLQLSTSPGNPVLGSINEARVYFPTASLCD